MEIRVKAKSIYGVTKYYPACEKAKVFAEMLGTKTLTPGAIGHIRALGFNVFHVSLEELEVV
jgi:hypothetical protein